MKEFQEKFLKTTGVLVGLCSAFVILFLFSPTRYAFYPRCPLHVWTGLHCPGCGSLRAVHSLLHGDFLSALRFNALLILSAPLLGLLLVNSVRAPEGNRLLKFEPRPIWIWTFVGVMLAFGVLRNLPFAPFSLLAP